MKRIALATCATLPTLNDADRLLIPALGDVGVAAMPAVGDSLAQLLRDEGWRDAVVKAQMSLGSLEIQV